MCGAFSIVLTPLGWKEQFQVEPPAKWQPIYNARPGEILPIITEVEPTKTTAAVWNFVPHWLKQSAGRGVINARAETVATKPYFRGSIKNKRCLIPADGFYEWARSGNIKVPYRFVQKNDRPFSFAGVYDEQPDDSGRVGFAIITIMANELVGQIHNRMPVILPLDGSQLWLDQENGVKEVAELLRPFPADQMKMYPVSQRVNFAKNKDAATIVPEK